jgi:1-deoxy-D-xylulose-5-phosphate synthase
MDLRAVRQPADIKLLNQAQVDDLAKQLRERIIQVVSQNGGHLASNLGAVELTLALHRVFDSPKDKILFDVGHQCYAHKMLTGRANQIDSLRQFGGISGFPKQTENEHDVYGTGHASTAISAALGMARARDIRGGREHVIAVVGDGAFTGGLCYEALNDAGHTKTRMIVVLNDNQMSIAPNVGGLSNYLNHMRTSKAWLHLKRRLSAFFLKLPVVGKTLYNLLQRVKDSLKNFFIKDHFFEALGFHYIGPVDGHNERYMEKILQRAKGFQEPVIIHVVTQKGKGYEYAEKEPWSTHGVNPFHPDSGLPRSKAQARSFGKAAGEELVELAKKDERIVAISAAMVEATGLGAFQKAYPHRLFDVGIAESHAVTLAAGLASHGMKPVVALYDTFLQRAYDQVVVDICLQELPVVFILDRAAMGGADGPTHHGVFGTALLRHVPNAVVLSPRSVEELQSMLRYAMSLDTPVFIRYPRTESEGMQELPYGQFLPGRWEVLHPEGSLCLIATGPMVKEALEARELLKKQGITARVVNASSIKPLDIQLIKELSLSKTPYYVLEENMLAGGLGSAIAELCVQEGLQQPEHIFALADAFVPHGSHEELLAYAGLDANSIAGSLIKLKEGIA